MDEKERITTNRAKKKKSLHFFFSHQKVHVGGKPGRWEKCHAELCSRKLLVKLYGEHPSVKYLSWRMFGGYGIRKGGGRVRDVVPHIIPVWLIFKGPNYKRPCIKVRHCKSHGQHQYLKLFQTRSGGQSSAAVSQAFPGQPSVSFPVPTLATFFTLFTS